LAVAELSVVREEPPAFHGEHEVGRGIVVPAPVTGGALERIEGAIDLDGAEPLARVLELARLREADRIENAAPGRVSPARDPDADVASPRIPETRRSRASPSR